MKQQRGVSLIAAIFIIVILAFIGVIFVSLISTSIFTSLNDMQATQAFFIAEGGVEFDQRSLALNLDWYRSTADPIAVTIRNLGAGTFAVSSTLPANRLRNRIPNAASVAPIRVYTANRFLPAGVIQVEDDIAGGAEFVRYTGIAGDTFTGITRNVTVGTVTGAAGNHPRGSTVYPVTTLVDALLNSCAAPASFRIAENTKFLRAGIVDIEGEEISYSGSSTAGGNRTLTGVQRCVGPTPGAAHAAGQPVTPVLNGGTSADVQSEIASTGTVGGAVRAMTKTVQR